MTEKNIEYKLIQLGNQRVNMSKLTERLIKKYENMEYLRKNNKEEKKYLDQEKQNIMYED